MIFSKNILFILLALSLSAFPQFKYQVNTETGYFNSKETNLKNNSFLLTRLDGEAKYDYENENRNASVLVNLRPEFYGINNSQRIFKARAIGKYFQTEDNFGFGFNITKQFNSYSSSISRYDYNIFTLTAETEWYFIEDLPFLLNAGYGFREINNNADYYYDIIFTELKSYCNPLPSVRVSYGLYFEEFNVENTLNFIPPVKAESRNSGRRWGPQLSLNYFTDFIINIDYNFLLHNSRLTDYPSYEQLFRLVAGKIFLTDFSAFILIDYYKRNLKVNKKFVEGITPLYVPLNFENRVYLKIGYDASDLTEVYIKTGYLKENLFNNEYSFSGWQILAGVQISN